METLRRNSIAYPFFAGLIMLSAFASAGPAKGMRVATDRDVVYITAGERVLMRYRYLDVPYKPYVDQLFSPGGVNILLDAPHDHLHHHALMYAITADGINFWEEFTAPGQQVHRSFSDVKVDMREETPFAGFSERLDWSNPRSKETILTEERTIEGSYLAGPRLRS